MKSLVSLLLGFSLFFPALALAELPAQVEADFEVVSGYLVMPMGDEYIVDLDDSDHLRVGDILTLVTPGRRIFHPVTNELLGTVDEPAGFLRVTRIKSGYSYAKPLTDGLEPANGTEVKRFEQVPALITGLSADDAALAQQLEMELPQFRWLEADEGDQALVTFELHPGRLEVKNTQGNVLRRYTVTAEQDLVAPAPAARSFGTARPGPEPKLMQKVADSIMGTLGLDNDTDPNRSGELFIRKQQEIAKQGVWMGPNLAGHPVGLAVADLTGDGQMETAVALDDRLLIARIIQGEYELLAEVPLSIGLEILSLDALDVDDNGRAELYLSAVNDHRPASLVVDFNGSGYGVVASDIRWFLRAVELPGREGRWLVGQKMGEINAFEGDLFHVRRDGNLLFEGAAIKLPDQLNIFSFVPMTDQQGQLLFVHLTAGDYLKVLSADGVTLWESEDYFGGSEVCFTHREEYRDEMLTPTCMSPRIIGTDGGEIIVAQNEGQRIMERYRKFSKSRVVALQWNGFALVENWRTASQSGYLGDFGLADADNDGSRELVMAIKFKHAGITDEARSSLVTYDMEAAQ